MYTGDRRYTPFVRLARCKLFLSKFSFNIYEVHTQHGVSSWASLAVIFCLPNFSRYVKNSPTKYTVAERRFSVLKQGIARLEIQTSMF